MVATGQTDGVSTFRDQQVYTNSSIMIEIYKFLLLHLSDVNGV